MPGFVGMNVEEVRALAQQMTSAANEVDSIAKNLTSKLQGTTWVGNDYTQFENTWNSSHVPALNNVVQALQQAAQHATRNAADQETVSNG